MSEPLFTFLFAIIGLIVGVIIGVIIEYVRELQRNLTRLECVLRTDGNRDGVHMGPALIGDIMYHGRECRVMLGESAY